MLVPWVSSVPLSYLFVMWQHGMIELLNNLPQVFFFLITSVEVVPFLIYVLPQVHYLTWQMAPNKFSVHPVRT